MGEFVFRACFCRCYTDYSRFCILDPFHFCFLDFSLQTCENQPIKELLLCPPHPFITSQPPRADPALPLIKLLSDYQIRVLNLETCFQIAFIFLINRATKCFLFQRLLPLFTQVLPLPSFFGVPSLS